MDRASAQPQVNLSLLRGNSLKFQPLTMLRLRSKSFFTFMAMSCYTKFTQTKKNLGCMVYRLKIHSVMLVFSTQLCKL
jgi:hypothetical protein